MAYLRDWSPARKELLTHLVVGIVILSLWVIRWPNALIWGLPCYVIGTICGRYGAICWYNLKTRRKIPTTEV